MSSNKQKASWWIIAAFMIVPLVTSLVSTIHVVSFFELSNYATLSIILAVAFELGALSSLGGLVVMDKISRSTVWMIFVLLTAFQMMGNTYYAYDTTTTKMIQDSNLIKNFTELFGFDIYDNSDVIFVKRIIAICSGAILPIISLCFLHLLMSYIIKSAKKDEVIESAVLEETKDQKQDLNTDTIIENKDNSEGVYNPLILPVSEKEKTKEEEFAELLKRKKEKLEKDRTNYSELLNILYKDGQYNSGDELPSYKEFVNLVDSNKYSTDTIKTFLTLLNYLDITKVSGEQKIALKSYEEAKLTLDNYLSLDIQQ